MMLDPNVEAALAEWEGEYRKITEQIQDWSISWDHFVHKWPLAFEGLRSSVVWSLTHFPVIAEESRSDGLAETQWIFTIGLVLRTIVKGSPEKLANEWEAQLRGLP